MRWVAEKVVGSDWPDADETSMQRLAVAWSEAASSLNDVADDGDHTARTVLAGISGDTAEAIAARWATVGPQGAIGEISQLCQALGQSLDGAAEDVRTAKLTIIAALVALVAELAVIAAASVLTFGAASPAAIAAEASTQVAVRMAIRQLVMSMLQRAAIGAAKGVATSSGLEALKEGALQTWEIHDGERANYDWGDVAEASGRGAVKGATTGALNGAAGIGLIDPRKLVTGEIGGEVQSATVGDNRFSDAVKDEISRRTDLDERMEDAAGNLREKFVR